MKFFDKVAIVFIAAAIGGTWVSVLTSNEADALDGAHEIAGYSPKCETLEEAGNTWGLCRIGQSAPAVWVRRGDEWAAGNDVALGVATRFKGRDSGSHLVFSHLVIDQNHPVTLPPAVLARL